MTGITPEDLIGSSDLIEQPNFSISTYEQFMGRIVRTGKSFSKIEQELSTAFRTEFEKKLENFRASHKKVFLFTTIAGLMVFVK